MTERRELTVAVERRLDEELIEPAIEAGAEVPRTERIRKGVETAVEVAEMNLDRAREALWDFRQDRATLERVEAQLGGSSERATLAMGAAIQLFASELSSSTPDLRGRIPELLRWLQGEW
jgi:hypothetical protein